MRMSVTVVATVLLLASWLAGALAQNAPSGTEAERWDRILGRAEAYLDGNAHSQHEHSFLLKTVQAVADEAKEIERAGAAAVAATQRLLDALGPAPKEGEPAELPDVAAKRKALEDEITRDRGRQAQAQLAIARGRAIEQRFSATYRDYLISFLTTRMPSPLAPATLAQGLPELGRTLATTILEPIRAVTAAEAEQRQALWRSWRTVALILAIPVGMIFGRLLTRFFGSRSGVEAPSYTLRVTVALVRAIAATAAPVAFLAALYLWVVAPRSPITGHAADVMSVFCAAVAFFLTASSLVFAMLSVDAPAWRCLPLETRSARRLRRRAVALLALFTFHQFMANTSETNPDEFDAAVISLYASLFAALAGAAIVLLMRDAVWRRIPADAAADSADAKTEGTDAHVAVATERPLFGGRAWQVTRRAIVLLTLVGVAAAAAGYQALSFYIISNTLLLIVLIFAIAFVHGVIRDVVGAFLSSGWGHRRLRLSAETIASAQMWIGAATDFASTLGAMWVMAVNLGARPETLNSWISQSLEGFTIGNVTISITGIVAGLAVLILGLLLTRLVRTTLAESLLPRTRLEPGLRNSISVGTGYVGVILSVLLATTALGLDLSNLAIVAGALSVGIGLGLQNITNNFVSGIILLAERPVKVGDQVIIDNRQGIVRRINVRATEIETFDRSSVIVPNSALISGTVVNLTHTDKVGRVDIQVGVAYGSDTQKVRDVLIACASDHEDILSFPRPTVFFMAFGDSALNFELRAFVRDIDRRLTVSSDLRFAIDNAFREAGIEIPFPQRDVHVKTVDAAADGEAARPAAPPLAIQPGTNADAAQPGPKGTTSPPTVVAPQDAF